MAVQETVEAPTRIYTAADLETMPQDGTRRELIEGKLIEMPGAKPNHNLLAFVLAKLLDAYASQLKSGLVIPEVGCRFTRDPDTLMFPDIGYISFGRLGAHNMGEYLPFAPDLAVEIISPGNTAEDINNKIDWYLRFGARLIWVVHPRTRKIYVYSTEKPFEIVAQDGVLEGGSVLPEFTLSLSEIFREQEKKS